MEVIEKKQLPVGANQIKRELADTSIKISEATVGRVLASLDQDGLTKKRRI